MKLDITDETMVDVRTPRVEMSRVSILTAEAYFGLDGADRAWLRNELANHGNCTLVDENARLEVV
jgi:hypothetical protein